MRSISYGLLLVAYIPFFVGCIPKTQGAGGAAGSVESSPEGKKCPPDAVIDDGEDNNHQAIAQKGRGGYWYTFVDKAGSTVSPTAGEQGGTFAMAPGGANGSAFAARATAKLAGGNVVFAGVGVNFTDPKGPYDASAYKGISFWAKRSETSASKVRVKLPDVNTDPDGKVCTECYNDFGMDIELTPAWTKYTIPFNQMSQQSGWGAPRTAAIEVTRVYGIQLQASTPGAEFDIAIDDLEFTGCP
jgi:endoglucanase